MAVEFQTNKEDYSHNFKVFFFKWRYIFVFNDFVHMMSMMSLVKMEGLGFGSHLVHIEAPRRPHVIAHSHLKARDGVIEVTNVQFQKLKFGGAYRPSKEEPDDSYHWTMGGLKTLGLPPNNSIHSQKFEFHS